jgi:hypothetical protein
LSDEDLKAPDLVEQMMDLAEGCFSARVVQVAAELGVADLLIDGPKSAASLAREMGAHPPSLYRLLRALASTGVLEHQSDDCFALTELGATLVSNAPRSARGGVLLYAMWWRLWEELTHSIRTGEAAAPRVYGQPFFDHVSANPELAAIFHEGMRGLNASVLPAIVNAYDFSQHGLIVDVGGGHGTLLAAALEAAPASKGLLFDLPSVVEGARTTLTQQGLAERVLCVAGDMFDSLPSGGDAYLLKWILHDWDDEACAKILDKVRAAMRADGRLLIVDRLLPARATASPASQRMMMIDLRMLVGVRGRERTEAEMRDLLNRSGLDVVQIIATTTPTSIVVARLTKE